jgi:hypothetical protein
MTTLSLVSPAYWRSCCGTVMRPWASGTSCEALAKKMRL